MPTPQTITRVGPRFPTRQTALLTALGVLIAVAVSIAFLALTGAHHTTTTTTIPVTSPAASGSASQGNYVGRPGHRYWCVPHKICLPVR
jgi:hypothetical protein